MTYEELITNIGTWVNRTHGEFDDVIAEQIIESQYELEKKFPLWFLLDEYTHVIPANSSSTSLPNFIIKPVDLEIEDLEGYKHPVFIGTKDTIRDRYPAYTANSPVTGRPKVATVKGHVLQYAPQADRQYLLRMWAHHHLDPLNLTTNTSNEWTTIYLSALRYHVLVAMSAFIGDDGRIKTWEARLIECIADIETEIANMENVGTRETLTDTEEIY
jgi:hypothetical protein